MCCGCWQGSPCAHSALPPGDDALAGAADVRSGHILRPAPPPDLCCCQQAGVLLPGIVQLAADLAKVRVQPSLTVLTTLFAYDRSLIYILHFALFAFIIFCDEASYVRNAYYAVSAIVVLRATFFPRSFRREDARFDAHIYEPPGTFLPMAVFWLVVFAAKMAIEMSVVLRAVVQASERLEALKPLQPFLDFSLLQQVFTSPALMTRFGQQMMLWSVSFLSYCSSTYFW